MPELQRSVAIKREPCKQESSIKESFKKAKISNQKSIFLLSPMVGNYRY